ncbi:MAG: serine/threonine protein kinase [Nannocystaceae bacterium]|nr:serine/threonine protein kinase [Nannocystaceae bacterium]
MGVDVEAEALRASVRSRLFGETSVSTLGRYQLQRQIGRGGMGVVYAALDPELGRTVALKVLRSQGTGGSQQAREARLVREARALARLSHPNVVSVYAVERIDDVLCIAMEFVRGETLAAWLTAQPRRDIAIVTAFVDAARGLAAAHRSGIVHRDFKPLNVMVGASEGPGGRGRVRVLDFGLALTDPLSEETTTQNAPGSFESGSGTETQTGTVMGTRGYMAPELGGGTASAASDQYAFFISLFNALTQRDSKDPPLKSVELTRVPRRLRPVLRRGLAKDPAARWSDLNDAADALLQAIAPRWPLLAATASTALALAGAAWISTTHAEPNPCAAFDARAQATWSPARIQDLSLIHI